MANKQGMALLLGTMMKWPQTGGSDEKEVVGGFEKMELCKWLVTEAGLSH